MKKRTQKQTLLLGKGIHQHTLYGDFMVDEQQTDFAQVSVVKESLLRHEKPNGTFGEHKTLRVEKGDWVMGKQVEYNPFNQTVTRVWD